jgi:hypothetical protein
MMRKVVLLLALLLLTVQLSAAQGVPGYEIVSVAPQGGMYRLSCEFSFNVLNVQNGLTEARGALISGFVNWINPAGRAPDYYVVLRGADRPGWFIFNQATMESFGIVGC